MEYRTQALSQRAGDSGCDETVSTSALPGSDHSLGRRKVRKEETASLSLSLFLPLSLSISLSPPPPLSPSLSSPPPPPPATYLISAYLPIIHRCIRYPSRLSHPPPPPPRLHQYLIIATVSTIFHLNSSKYFSFNPQTQR